jgi:hypothetical protein
VHVPQPSTSPGLTTESCEAYATSSRNGQRQVAAIATGNVSDDGRHFRFKFQFVASCRDPDHLTSAGHGVEGVPMFFVKRWDRFFSKNDVTVFGQG